MDSFDPYANAWGDDPSTSTNEGSSGVASTSSFKFPDESKIIDSNSQIHDNNDSSSNHHDPLGFKATPAVVLAGDEDDAWGAPAVVTASTSRAATPAALGVVDEWSTAPSTPKLPQQEETNTEETSWEPAGVSPVLSSSPPAWAIEDDEPRRHSPAYEEDEDRQHKHDEDDNEHNSKTDEAEDGGFGGFSEALPDLSSTTRTPPTLQRRDSDTDWGATELPPSKWDEHINAPPPPTWPDSSATDHHTDDTAADADGTSDPWRPAQARRHSSNDNNASSTNRRSIDMRKVSEEAELDIEKLQSELGIQIRNLDEEYSAAKSPTLGADNARSPTTSTAAPTGKTSRWGLWSSAAKKPTSTSEDGGSRRASIDRNSLTSPRSSISTAGINSASTSAPQTPDVQSDTTNAAQDQQQQAQQQAQAGVSRFFRFGKGRTNTSDPAASSAASSKTASSPGLPSTAQQQQVPQQLEMMDDFSQLENFDSKRSTSANGIQSTSSSSGYDEFGISSYSKDDDEPERKGWFWNRRPVSPGTHRALQARSKVVDYSNEQDEEQDLDKVFSAFSSAPPPLQSSSTINGVARQPSLRSQGRPSSAAPANARNARDPFAHLSAAASSIRSSASVDPFDPLDPLAELNQASNITSRPYRDRPSPSLSSYSPSLGSRIPTKSPPILAPPPSSSSTVLARPRSANTRISNTATPAPLLAPPPPLSSVSRKTPQPSLLDDLADLNLSSTSTSSPASGPGPTVTQAPMAIKPPSSVARSTNLLDDDFGDFETFAPGSSQGQPKIDKPAKANGPMKLAGNKVKDVDFFDLL